MKRAVLAYETGRMAVKYGLFHGSEWHRSENDANGAGHKPSNHSSGATSRLKAADIKYNKKMMCDEEVFDKHNALVDYLLGVQCRRMPAAPPHELSLKDIVTLQSFAFSILTIMALNYVNKEKE